MKYETIIKTIGNTPLVKLQHYSTKNVEIYAKLEGSNPGGSVKDRPALFMMLDAEKKGILSKDKEILEATSGNMGISIAMLSTLLGYKFTAVMPESVSIERRKLLEAFGAQIILTDGPKGTNFAIERAKEIINAEHKRYVALNQFENSFNTHAHFETTGPEIIKDLPHLTHFVAGMGTGGTLMGVGAYLKQVNPSIKIVGVEPIPFSTIQGLRNMKAYTPPIFNEQKLDQKLIIPRDEIAFEYARELFINEGISVGISSGAALWGALELAKTITSGVIVTIFPDRGDRYASTKLF